MSAPTGARADHSTIRDPGDRTRYGFEAEPHLLLTPFDPPGPGGGSGVGLGFRGTIPIVENGFIGRINNSVGIGFGVDWVHYAGSRAVSGYCDRWEPGPADTRVCVEVHGGSRRADYLWFPVVMQWNFWLTQRWSAFGEIGAAAYFRDGQEFGIAPFIFGAGGRFLFTDRIGLAVRLGYPASSLGVTFLL